MTAKRNTSTRDRHRRIIAADEPPCHLQAIGQCLYPGQPIDYEAHHLDPMAFTIDHIKPLALGGTDTLDNLGPAHRACNRAKSDKLVHAPGITYITDRNWE